MVLRLLTTKAISRKVPSTLIRKRSLGKTGSFFRNLAVLAGIFIFLFSQNGLTAYALTQPQKDTIGSGARYFNVEDDGSGVCTASGSVSGAKEAFAKQTGMDNRWADLIIEKANKYGTDPVAMASILYWENRGWPPFQRIVNGDPANGLGPWQFLASTWINNFPEYTYDQVYDPIPSTDAAARWIKSAGGIAGSPVGSIEQDFSKGKNLPSMATVMKVYNAGGATYRDPAIAKYNQPGRIWYEGDQGDWTGRDPNKPMTIDDYIVAGTYLYYQIATGEVITYKDTASYVQEALGRQNEIKNFSFGNSTGSVCDSVCTPSGSGTVNGKTVVIDPGHSPAIDSNSKDQVTGLYTADYPNPPPEMQSAYEVATKIKEDLTSRGYDVVLTKNSANEKIDLAERAKRANSANPALLFTIHGDVGARFLAYPDEKSTRVPGDGPRKDGKNGLVDPTIIGPSRELATKLAPIIANKTGESGYKATSFYGYYGADGLAGNGKNKGNTPVQTILSTVPSVYSEYNVKALDNKFATAVSDAIAEVLGSAGDKTSLPGSASQDCGVIAGSIVQTALGLAWPSGDHGKEKEDATPAYQIAMPKYNGSTGTDVWSDCGVFTATVMISSGADTSYAKKLTWVQMDYVRNNPNKFLLIENIGDTSKLQPGDILLYDGPDGGHTFVYVGSQPGFSGDKADASLGDHVPQAGNAVSSFNYNGRAGKYIAVRMR